ncbi:hypothetical protein, partial [Ureaplasma zalophigenitalium]
ATDLKTDEGINKKLLESKIENSLQLEIFRNQFFEQNKAWFAPDLIANIEQWFVDNCQKQANTSNILLFWYIIIKQFKKEIHNLYKKTLA